MEIKFRLFYKQTWCYINQASTHVRMVIEPTTDPSTADYKAFN